MSAVAKTFGSLAVALVGLLVYLATYVIPMSFVPYLGMALTALFLVIVLVLCFGKTGVGSDT